MKKFLANFFIVLGVIFFGILLTLAYLFIVDPYNIKPFIFQSEVNQIETIEMENDSNDANQTITPAPATTIGTDVSLINNNSDDATTGTVSITEGQKKALELVGIDPAVLSSLSSEQEACFVAEFGQERVDEIKAGAIPSPLELLTGKQCL